MKKLLEVIYIKLELKPVRDDQKSVMSISLNNSTATSTASSTLGSRRGSASGSGAAGVVQFAQKLDPSRKCQILNSRKLLREESVEHRDPKYNRFAQNKRRYNQEILEKGTGKEPVVFHSPQPIREFDYNNPIAIQLVQCRGKKVRIIKSSNELKLPQGIEDAKIFQDIVKMYNDDSLSVKKLSLKYLLNQDEECHKLAQKVRDLEEKIKNAPSPSEIKKNPFASAEGSIEDQKLSFCKKCRDVLTDDDLKSDDINKSLLDYQSTIKKKITGMGLLGLLNKRRLVFI